MTTIAIIGAGPGLGAAAARRIGTAGFSVALLARSQERLNVLAGELTTAGITAAGYATNVREPEALAGALQRAAEELAAPLLASATVGSPRRCPLSRHMAELVVHVQITPKTTPGERPDRLAPVDRSAFVLASAPNRRGSAIVQRLRSPTAPTDPRTATDLFA